MQPLRALFLFAAFLLAAAPARAEITLTPLRQVITEKAPVATYRVSNPSRRIVDGRVSWIDLTATETGYKEASPEAREAISAAPYLTVSPASFRLEPGASTTITVTLRADSLPKSGERRSHLLIQTEAARTPIRKTGGSLEVDIGLGVSTPVILRLGDGKAQAKIGDTKLLRTPEGQLELETHVEPQGNYSAYGAIEVYLTPDGKKTPELLKTVENVAAYLDAQDREVTVPLDVRHLPGGMLEVRYAGRSEFEGRTFANRTFELAPPQ